MSDPFLSLHKRIWRIENATLRRAATVALAALVEVPAHLLWWAVCVPLFTILFPLFAALKGLFDALRELPGLTINEFRDWPDTMRKKRHTLRALWKSSQSVWEASRPTVVMRKGAEE